MPIRKCMYTLKKRATRVRLQLWMHANFQLITCPSQTIVIAKNAQSYTRQSNLETNELSTSIRTSTRSLIRSPKPAQITSSPFRLNLICWLLFFLLLQFNLLSVQNVHHYQKFYTKKKKKEKKRVCVCVRACVLFLIKQCASDIYTSEYAHTNWMCKIQIAVCCLFCAHVNFIITTLRFGMRNLIGSRPHLWLCVCVCVSLCLMFKYARINLWSESETSTIRDVSLCIRAHILIGRCLY